MESDSDGDSSTASLSALKLEEQEAHFWRQQFRRERQHSATLQGRIEFLEKKLEKQLTSSTLFKTFHLITCLYAN